MEMSETRLGFCLNLFPRGTFTGGPEFILLPRNAIDGNSTTSFRFVSFRFVSFDDILRGIPLSKYLDSMNLLSN